MELTKIKMAGFKSFVDPITITFPSQWNCIVGPNGCGKSNTIDAVRCVMGESAAKQLRGGAMEDMIFNGCATRQPVGQASIELFFDNSDGGLGGPYAAYSEIAIKRSVNRDGQSNYYLNGTRCRRRDISDVFLGTGLGPRSYSIVEQGTISRVIEAKPMELRGYLEEAAGVSRYKERRRETENRIKHTRENLERIADLRLELDKQIAHLKRQANAAERYQNLKAQARLASAQALVLNWNLLEAQRSEQALSIETQQTDYERAQANAQHIDTQLTELDVEHPEKQEAFNQQQAKVYACVAEINQFEQSIAHFKQTLSKRNDELRQIEADLLESQRHLGDDQSKCQHLIERKQTLEPALIDAREQHESVVLSLQQAQQASTEAQQQWEAYQRAFSQCERSVDKSTQQVQHLQTQIENTQAQLAQLQAEFAELDDSLQTTTVDDLTHRCEVKTQQLEQKQATRDEIKAAIIDVKQAISDTKTTLDNQNERKQTLQGELASLRALQKTALGKNTEALNVWLSEHHLAQQPRLAEQLDVEPAWALAVETVLSHELDAICVDDITQATTLHAWPSQSVTLYQANRDVPVRACHGLASLASKLRSGKPHPALAQVFIADSLAQALSVRQQLAWHESIITQQGLWLSATWLKSIQSDAAVSGVLQREQDIKTQQAQLEDLLAEIEATCQQIQNHETQLSSLEEQRESLHGLCQDINQTLAELKGELRAQSLKQEQTQVRHTKLAEQMDKLHQQLSDANTALADEKAALASAQAQKTHFEGDRERLLAQREQAANALDDAQRKRVAARDRLHEFEIQWKMVETELGSVDQAQGRLLAQIERLTQSRQALLDEADAEPQTLDSLQLSLEAALSHKLNAEEAFASAQQVLEAHEQQRRALEQTRSRAREASEQLRDALSGLQIALEALKVKQSGIQEQFGQTDFDFDTVKQSLDEEATLPLLNQQVEQLEKQINRLGAINLAAIDEYKAVSERKHYLDAQNDDLEKALATLEGAIRKIDQETRAKLRETFETINTKFQELFPKVFGGGQASLALTEQDWLTTGIAIMARPPGKRNASIHMLSGGEKALTAIAFVFAIFHLNPAPFCMLDEVDAPLDDANVERFCRLVEEMAKTVKFIIISHNKLTISKADNLIGVTMKEAGVSRTVSVDIEQAVAMTD